MNRLFPILLLFLLCGLSYNCSAQNVDINLLHWINQHRIKPLDPFFIFITDTTILTAYCLPLCLLIYGLFTRNRVLSWKAFFILASVAFCDLLATLMKRTFNRQRPFDSYTFMERMTTVTTSSFPSAHTIVAFALAASLSYAFPKWYVIIPAFLWAILVGYSRMCLGVHYPSDVGASIILAILFCYGIFRLGKYLVKYPVKA